MGAAVAPRYNGVGPTAQPQEGLGDAVLQMQAQLREIHSMLQARQA